MSTARLAEELRLIEEDLTRLRETAADLPEARREELLTRLGQPARTHGSRE